MTSFTTQIREKMVAFTEAKKKEGIFRFNYSSTPYHGGNHGMALLHDAVVSPLIKLSLSAFSFFFFTRLPLSLSHHRHKRSPSHHRHKRRASIHACIDAYHYGHASWCHLAGL